jgi:hypothetical protein
VGVRRVLAFCSGLTIAGLAACAAFSSSPPSDAPPAEGGAAADSPATTADGQTPDSPSDAGTRPLCSNPLLYEVRDNFLPGPDLPAPWETELGAPTAGGATTVSVDTGGDLLAVSNMQSSYGFGKLTIPMAARQARVRYTVEITGMPSKDAQFGCKIVLGKLSGKHMNTRLSVVGNAISFEADTNGSPLQQDLVGAPIGTPFDVDVTLGRWDDGGAGAVAVFSASTPPFAKTIDLLLPTPSALDVESSVRCGIAQTNTSAETIRVRIRKVTVELCP